MKMLIIAASATALMCGAAYAQQSPDTAAPANSAQPSAGDTTTTPTGTADMNGQANGAAGQPGMAGQTDQNGMNGQGGMAAPGTAGSADQSSGGAMTSSAPGSTMSGNVQVVASPPVPDTPENRAKYGRPLSNAGKHSKPAGN
jgi:hypothetical protein